MLILMSQGKLLVLNATVKFLPQEDSDDIPLFQVNYLFIFFLIYF